MPNAPAVALFGAPNAIIARTNRRSASLKFEASLLSIAASTFLSAARRDVIAFRFRPDPGVGAPALRSCALVALRCAPVRSFAARNDHKRFKAWPGLPRESVNGNSWPQMKRGAGLYGGFSALLSQRAVSDGKSCRGILRPLLASVSSGRNPPGSLGRARHDAHSSSQQGRLRLF